MWADDRADVAPRGLDPGRLPTETERGQARAWLDTDRVGVLVGRERHLVHDALDHLQREAFSVQRSRLRIED